jgi:uncharacterized RDD family membrane protein YckC
LRRRRAARGSRQRRAHHGLLIDSVEAARAVPHLAGVGSRGVAACIDVFLSGLAVGVPLTIALGDRHRELLTDGSTTTVSYTWSAGGRVTVLWLLLTIVYFVVFETAVGATFGKLLLGLRVRYEDGTPIGFGASLARNLFRVLDAFPYFLPYLAGAISIWSSSKRQRFGDRAARTIVVYK